MVKTIKNITNMFCDVIFSHLRSVSEVKGFTEVNVQIHEKTKIQNQNSKYKTKILKSFNLFRDEYDFLPKLFLKLAIFKYLVNMSI